MANRTHRDPIIALVALIAIEGCAGARVGPKPEIVRPPMSAELILKAMTDRYASMHSYEDKGTGTQLIRFDEGRGPFGTNIAFETVFDRGKGFCFDFSEATGQGDPRSRTNFTPPYSTRGVIWRTAPGPAHRWATFARPVEDTDIDGAIGAFAGISEGTSDIVPRVLLDGRLSFIDLTFELNGEEVIGATPCAKLTATKGDRTVSLWIGTEDHLLRRVFSHVHLELPAGYRPPSTLSEGQRRAHDLYFKTFHPFTVDGTIEYTPIVDGTVSADRFAFTPPEVPAAPAPGAPDAAAGVAH